MIKIIKNNYKNVDFYIILGIIILNLFWLPSSSFWSLELKKHVQKDDKLQTIIDYNHPPIPKIINKQEPSLSAQNFILLDSETNTVLLSKNANTKVYPASITKIVTSLISLNSYSLDEEVQVKELYKEGNIMNLQLGERLTIRSLIESAMVFSANDAAYNLASHYSKGKDGFVEQMNIFAQKANLKNTHFTNFDGLHHPEHYSSPYDLSQIGRLAMRNPTLRKIVLNKKITVTSVDGAIKHDLKSTDELLDVIPEVEGFKTGWTPEAGGCFLGLININGHYLISVVSQSNDRFADTKILINWAKNNINWESYK